MIRYKRDLVESVNSERVDIINDPINDIHIEKREVLDINLNKVGNKKVLVIMMNPSKADSIQSDRTVNDIIEYFSKDNCGVSNENNQYNNGQRIINDVKHIFIRNLFSIYNPYSSDLYRNIQQIINISYECIDELIKSNTSKIHNAIRDSDYIVLGWGNCPKSFHSTIFYQQIIDVMKNIIKSKKKQIFIFHIRNNRSKARGVECENILTDEKNPVHPCNGEIISLLRIDIDSILRIIPRE